MSEPLIPNPNPVSIPAKTYAQQYITKTIINAKPGEPWNAIIESKPYDGEVGVLDTALVIQLQDIKACAVLVPELALAMQKMIEVLGMVSIAARATDTKIITPDNIVQILAALEA